MSGWMIKWKNDMSEIYEMNEHDVFDIWKRMNESMNEVMNELKQEKWMNERTNEWMTDQLNEWNSWIEMNELTWMNWNEWLDIHELE